MAAMVSDISKCALNGEMVDFGQVAFVTSLNLLSNTIFSVDFVETRIRKLGENSRLP